MTNHSAGTRLSPKDAARIAAEAAARYYDRAHAWRFDPFHRWDQLLVLVILALIVTVLLWNWRALLKCVFGDDTIRCDRFYLAYWGLLECCGACDGEWTRCLSSICCACCRNLAGRNLKRACGESLGIYPVAVRVSNIVVGRLPQEDYSFFTRSPDLYLQVIPDELQPKLNTELVSEANVECVQFTSSLTLLLKNNTWEDPVRFVVKKMNLTSSKDVAECFICPTRLIAWANNNEKVRIQMGGPCRTWDPTCTPWILLDMSRPMESDSLYQQGAFRTVTTEYVKEFSSSRDVQKSWRQPTKEGIGFSPLPITITTTEKEYGDLNKFREDYPLKNASGQNMIESKDDMMYRAHRCGGACCYAICWAIFLCMAYGIPRLLNSFCWEEYRSLLVTKRYCDRQTMTFPPEDESVQESVMDWCKTISHSDVLHLLTVHMLRRGRHGVDQDDLPMSCFPSPQEIVSYCEGDWPDGLKRPHLLGFHCPHWSCRFSEAWEQSFLDYIFWGLLVMLCIGACICRCCYVAGRRYETQVPQSSPGSSPSNFDQATMDNYARR